MKKQIFYVYTIREKLRQASVDASNKLNKSVSRLTSYDNLPCDEYYLEVQNQKKLVNKILYLQNCRAAVERCISTGAAVVKFKIAGDISITRFYLTKDHKIKAIGLSF